MRHLVVVLLIAAPFLILFCSPRGPRSEAGAAAKLDPRLRSRLPKPAANAAEVTVLIKFKQPLTPAQQAQLQEQGVQLLAHTGTVATATLPDSALLPVAELDFVSYLEPSKDYHPQQDAVH